MLPNERLDMDAASAARMSLTLCGNHINNSWVRERGRRLRMSVAKGKLGLVVLLFIVFIVGCLVGLGTSSYLYYRNVFSKRLDRNATDLGGQINTVSRLRLGEIDGVINDLEMSIDGNIRSVALTPHIPRTDYRYKVLRAAKTYREIYPSKSGKASQVNEALREIPKIHSFKCESPLCRLVDRVKDEAE